MGAEIQDGCVLVARAILNSSLWTMRAEDRLVAITCICLANWRPRKWWNGKESMEIGRGQFVRSWQHLADECKLSIKTVRTSVKNLEMVGFLARKRAGHVQVFTMPKYDHYQDLTKYSDSIVLKTGKETGSYLADDGQATGSEVATNNNLIREEGKNGRTHKNGTAAAHVITDWNSGPGFPISHPQGQKMSNAYNSSGISFQRQLELQSDRESVKGKKFWEVMEPHRQKQEAAGVGSIEDILKGMRYSK